MNLLFQIAEPVLFNPLKHHLGYIKDYIYFNSEYENVIKQKEIIRELKHLGTSVMDIYTGSLSVDIICKEVKDSLEKKGNLEKESFARWTGTNINNYRIISLSDSSQWILKCHTNKLRFVHIFPARNSQLTFRIKANTLKSAILFNIQSGKDFISSDEINMIRTLLNLSPIKESADMEAITEMIEILRN